MSGIAHSLGMTGDSAGSWILLLVAFELVTLGLAAGAWRRMGRITRRWDDLLKGSEGVGVLSLLESQIDELRQHGTRLDRIEGKGALLSDQLAASVRKVGIVKYDAFEDVGGEQSFALALLDDRANGAVITGIVGRAESRVFAKELRAGQAKVSLTAEEQAAIQAAERWQ